MFSKTSLVKVVFVISILAVMALAAVAPSIARAFFSQGLSGFSNRLFGGQNAIAPLQQDASKLMPAQVESSVDNSQAADSKSSASTVQDYFEFTGTLSAKEGNLWTVDDVLVYISPSTELKGVFEVGAKVKVEGALQADGSVLARQIKPAVANANPSQNQSGSSNPGAGVAPSMGNEIEFIGTLSEKTNDQWLVSGVRVFLLATTEVYGAPVVGDLVKVEGALLEDGAVQAREIKPAVFEGANPQPSAGNSIEFIGKLTEKTDTMWVVSNLRVMLAANTEIYGAPALGDLVKVEGTLQDDGSVLAREIKPALFDAATNPGNNPPGEFEFTGTLQAKNGNVWVINGFNVVVTPRTELKGALAIGEIVKVHGTRQADGSIVAREIENDDRSSGKSGSDDSYNDKSGSGDDDNSGRGGDDDRDDDHSGHDGDDDQDDDHSGRGGGDDDKDDDRRGKSYDFRLMWRLS